MLFYFYLQGDIGGFPVLKIGLKEKPEYCFFNKYFVYSPILDFLITLEKDLLLIRAIIAFINNIFSL